MKLSLIAAVGRNLELGHNGGLLLKSSRDMKHFKTYTTGTAVIVGRKTWDSIGRPLPHRHVAVVSRTPELVTGADSVHDSLESAIESLSSFLHVVVIGGGEIYRQAMGLVDVMTITHIDGEFTADTFFPEISPSVWEIKEARSLGVDGGYELTVVTYGRKS